MTTKSRQEGWRAPILCSATGTEPGVGLTPDTLKKQVLSESREGEGAGNHTQAFYDFSQELGRCVPGSIMTNRSVLGEADNILYTI